MVLFSRSNPGGRSKPWGKDLVLEVPRRSLPALLRRVLVGQDKALPHPGRQERTQRPAKAIFSSPAWKWQEIISVPSEESFTDILHGAVSAQNYLLPFRTLKIISIAEEN